MLSFDQAKLASCLTAIWARRCELVRQRSDVANRVLNTGTNNMSGDEGPLRLG